MFTAQFDRELFLEKLNKLSAFIPKKSVTPCFENIKISIGAGIAELIASDGQTQITLYTECKSKDTFIICVPAKIFIATISLFRENEVVIKSKDKIIELKSGKSKYKITMDTLGSEYPVMWINAPTSEIAISQSYLKQALKSTEGFVDEKNPLPNLIGVHIASVDKKIVFTGAIQQMICRYECNPISINKWDSIVLPIETAKKTCTILRDMGEINIIHSKDKVQFFSNTDSTDRFEITSTLADVNYPDSDALFKNCPEEHIIFNTVEVSDALKRLKLYTLELPRVEIKTNERNLDELILTAVDDLTGKSGEEIVSVRNMGGKHIDKTYNADQLIKILKEVDNNEVSFHYNPNSNKPSQILPISEKEGVGYNYRFLVVAMMEL